MDERLIPSRIMHALLLVLTVCVGVRVAAWVIEPVLPLLGGLVVLVGIGYLLLLGPRHRG